jgi:hypothetical protein
MSERKSMIGYRKPKSGEWILRDGWRWPEKPCVNGHTAPRNKFNHCMQCVREYRASKGHFSNLPSAKKWRDENKAWSNENRRRYTLLNPERRMLSDARRTAKAKGLPFNLTLDDISVPPACPVLGIPLTCEPGPRKDGVPSLDRIVPALGYVKGNVVVVSWRANRIKCDATIEELERVAAYYKKIRQQQLPLD